MDVDIILASQSAVRKKMLDDAGFRYEVIVSNADETPDESKTISEQFKDISMRKAKVIFEQTVSRGKRIIVAADTNYMFEGKLYGKPKTLEEARSFIKKNAGRNELYAYTGNAIIYADHGTIIKTVNTCDISRLRVDNISDNDLDEYFSHTDPLKRAGGMNLIDCPFLHLEEGYASTCIGMTIEHLQELISSL